LQIAVASFKTASFGLHHPYKPGPFEYALSAGYARSDGNLKNGRLNQGNPDLHRGYDFPFAGRLTADIFYLQLKKGFIMANRVSKSPDDMGYSTAINPDFPASDGECMYGGMGAYPHRRRSSSGFS
jgi:hypothetical protein